MLKVTSRRRVTYFMLNNKEKHLKFGDLAIKPAILTTLEKNGLIEPTPIQSKAIPVAISGKDLIGIAQTGTGKTLAFGIPLVQRLLQDKSRALVLLPTRELAVQVEESLRKISFNSGLRTISLIGGEAINRQIYGLKYNPRIMIATPGRLLDHYKRKTINLENISVLVLDEADMMFDLGFAPQIEEIIQLTPINRQTLLFSATMPAPIIKLAEKYLKSPLQIEVAPAGTTAELVDQEIYLVHREERLETLKKILLDYKNLVLIFVRTKHGATNLTEKLKTDGHQVSEIHSNLSFGQRKMALASFKNGTKRILVATDVAARGLDIKDIELVLNFDLPDNSEDYVHRIGRTARAGKGGKAISFALPHQRREIQRIERLIRKNLPLLKIGSLKAEPERRTRTKETASSYSKFGKNNFAKSRDFNRNNQSGFSRSRFSENKKFEQKKFVRSENPASFNDRKNEDRKYGKDEKYKKEGGYSFGERYNKDKKYDRDEKYDRDKKYDRGEKYDKNKKYDRNERYNKDKKYGKDEKYGKNKFSRLENFSKNDFRGISEQKFFGGRKSDTSRNEGSFKGGKFSKPRTSNSSFYGNKYENKKADNAFSSPRSEKKSSFSKFKGPEKNDYSKFKPSKLKSSENSSRSKNKRGEMSRVSFSKKFTKKDSSRRFKTNKKY